MEQNVALVSTWSQSCFVFEAPLKSTLLSIWLTKPHSQSLSLLLSLPLLFSVRSTYKLFAAYQRVAVVHFYGHLLLFSPFLVTYPGPVGSPIEKRVGGGEWGQAGAGVCESRLCSTPESRDLALLK